MSRSAALAMILWSATGGLLSSAQSGISHSTSEPVSSAKPLMPPWYRDRRGSNIFSTRELDFRAGACARDLHRNSSSHPRHPRWCAFH